MSKNVQGGNTTYNIPHKTLKSDETIPEDDTNPEDDSQIEGDEEETEETDDTESNEETEGEKDSDDTEESEGEEPEQILDLTKVPPQLKEVAKKMISTQNKWITRAKKAIEDKQQELTEKYSEEIVKAAGFDKLTKLKGFDEFWDDISNGREYGYSSKFRSNGKDTSEEDDSSASENGKVSVEGILQRLGPEIRKIIANELGPVRKEAANNLWADAEKNLKNFKKYKADITSILAKHPSMSIKEAYDRASEKDRMDEAIKVALEEATNTGKKIPKKTLKPGSSTGGKGVVDRKTIDSIDAALNAAANKLGR